MTARHRSQRPTPRTPQRSGSARTRLRASRPFHLLLGGVAAARIGNASLPADYAYTPLVTWTLFRPGCQEQVQYLVAKCNDVQRGVVFFSRVAALHLLPGVCLKRLLLSLRNARKQAGK